MSSGSPADETQVFLLGATHHRVPIEVRERLALGAEGAEAMRAQLSQMKGLREHALLSTCNRVEFYGVCEDESVVVELTRLFCARQSFPVESFTQVALSLRGREAVQHLFEVASGLDSQMLGETEIFGQVKDAYILAQQRGSTGAILNKVFQKAFQAAKHVRTDTAISIGQVSVANVAVDLATDIFGSLVETKILLVGAGEIGEKTAQAFRSRGAASLTVCSRTMERALELASALGALALPFDQRASRLSEYDIVVCATSAPDAVISAIAAEQAMHRRPARPLLFVDLAMPRDVDPEVTRLGNVYLYNLDDLARVAEENRHAREAEVDRAREILAGKSAHLWDGLCPRLRK